MCGIIGYTGTRPALALLLAGPAVSLPNMLVVGRIIGVAKTLIYIALVIIFSSAIGLFYGWLVARAMG